MPLHRHMLHCSFFTKAQAALVKLGLRSKSIGEVLATLWLLGAPVSIAQVVFCQTVSQAASIAFPFSSFPWILRPSEAWVAYAWLFLLFSKGFEVVIDAFLFSLIVFDECQYGCDPLFLNEMVVAGKAPHCLLLGFLWSEDIALAGHCLAYVLSFH